MLTRAHTPSELAEILAPQIGAKINGRAATRTTAVDLIGFGSFIDADIRAVGAEGVTVFFSRGTELVRWDKLALVRIATINELGDRIGGLQSFVVGDELERAA